MTVPAAAVRPPERGPFWDGTASALASSRDDAASKTPACDTQARAAGRGCAGGRALADTSPPSAAATAAEAPWRLSVTALQRNSLRLRVVPARL